MGFREWIENDRRKGQQTKMFYEIGCEILGRPRANLGAGTVSDRIARVNAGRAEWARRNLARDQQQSSYTEPSRQDGYYSQMRKKNPDDIERFIGKDGRITSERPHVHVIHSSTENQIILVATHTDGTHGSQIILGFGASGNEVNQAVDRLRSTLR